MQSNIVSCHNTVPGIGTTQSVEEGTDEEPTVAAGVLDGIKDVEAGLTVNGDYLDEALDR